MKHKNKIKNPFKLLLDVGKQIEKMGTELLFDRSIENQATSTTDGKGKNFL